MNRLLIAVLASSAAALVQRGDIGTACKTPSGKGVCGSVKGATCKGYYLPGYCPGNDDVQCCITATSTKCTTPDGPGICGRTEAGTCDGFYTAGFCPGDRNFQCCVPSEDPAPDTPDGDDSDEADVVTTPIVDEIPELGFDLDTEIASNSTITGDEVDLDDEEDPLISTRAAAKLTKGQLIVKAAEKWLGKKYVFGGGVCSGPSNGGFDCSGLVLHAVCKVTKKTLPHKAQSQYNLKKGKHIPLSKIKPGDALFWAYGKNCKSRVHHVAIYIGKNKKGVRQIIHAPHTGSYVKKANVWTKELCGSAVRFW